jgi:very-long-chain enoyl-CoA reductase
MIPRLHGYSFITCANYFWEFIALLSFCFIAQAFTSTAFVIISFFRMNYRAHRKYHRYTAEFKNHYLAEERWYFIPYLV